MSTSANFYRNPASVDVLYQNRGVPASFRVVKILQLPERTFEDFILNFRKNRSYIASNRALIGPDLETGDLRCLLVSSLRGRIGILIGIDSEHTQCASYVPDIGKLQLDQVPVEQYRRSRARRER